MADQTYTLEAVLSARDAGFSAGMKAALNKTETFSDKLKSGVGFGVFQAIGNKALNAVTSGISDMGSELSSSQAAWKTYEGTMKNFGASAKEIQKVKEELQDYAQATIYSSSDMSSTYAQLAAVGIKESDKLVMAFGGLASAAENPTQAMKTLSQQATQMAAKPKVQWEDFKLMLEQTPAGIAAVAKQMGMSTGELIKNVQSGTLSTQEFFENVKKVGNDKSWQNQAKQYKTVDQAMDGLKETMSNDLMPVYNAVTDIIIDDIDSLADASGKVDFKSVGEWITKNQDKIKAGAKAIAGLAAAITAMKVVNSIAGTFKTFVGGVKALASPKLLGRLVPNLFSTAAGEEAAGTAAAASSKNILQEGAAFLMVGAGVALAAAGFFVLAKAAVMVANAGAPAVVVFGMMVTGIGALMAVASKLGPTMTQGAVGMLAFGAALVLAGAGMYLMAQAAVTVASAGTSAIAVLGIMTVGIAGLIAVVSLAGPAFMVGAAAMVVFGAGLVLVGAAVVLVGAGLKIMAGTLPVIAQYGNTAASAMALMGASLLLVGTSSLVGTAGLTALSAVMALFAAACVVASGSAVTYSASLVITVGLAKVLGASLKAVAVQTKAINSSSKSAASSLREMTKSVSLVNSGLSALESKAKGVMSHMESIFRSSSTSITKAGRDVGNGFSNGLRSGMSEAPTIASNEIKRSEARLRSGHSGFYSAGRFISEGFALGMESALGRIEAAADKMVKAADKAARAKAKVGSPSRVFMEIGNYIGEGFAIGIEQMQAKVEDAAEGLIYTPQLAGSPAYSLGGTLGTGMYDEYSYGLNAEYVINVPVQLDGREVAKVTAPYTEAELAKRDTRTNRKKGRR